MRQGGERGRSTAVRSPQRTTKRVTDASSEAGARGPFEAVGQERAGAALYRQYKGVDQRNRFEQDHRCRQGRHHTTRRARRAVSLDHLLRCPMGLDRMGAIVGHRAVVILAFDLFGNCPARMMVDVWLVLGRRHRVGRPRASVMRGAAPEHRHRRGTLKGYRQGNKPHQNDPQAAQHDQSLNELPESKMAAPLAGRMALPAASATEPFRRHVLAAQS